MNRRGMLSAMFVASLPGVPLLGAGPAQPNLVLMQEHITVNMNNFGWLYRGLFQIGDRYIACACELYSLDLGVLQMARNDAKTQAKIFYRNPPPKVIA